jgi:hypothetical protein
VPQASDELREEMNRRFGDPISEQGPIDFLRSAGYTLHFDWTWSKPGVNDLRDMTRDEFDCLLFLIHEWDFGSLRTKPSDPT